MGALSDKANQQSKFLMIEKGSSVLVKYLDYRFVPSQKDPSVEVVQYKFMQDGREKYWTNGNGTIMRKMDKIVKGSWVIVNRGQWLNKDGSEDKSKSSYMVTECDDQGNPLEGQENQSSVDVEAWK